VEQPSKSYTWHKWSGTPHMNQNTVEPVQEQVVYQIIGHVAFSEVTMYYIDQVHKPPTRRPVDDPEVVEVVQAYEFEREFVTLVAVLSAGHFMSTALTLRFDSLH
jgi:hypothetical protein